MNEAHPGQASPPTATRPVKAAKPRRLLPGFGLTFGVTLTGLSLLVLIPLGMVAIKAAGLSWDEFWGTISAPRAVDTYILTFSAALGAAALVSIFGLVIAWVLVRYRFPGRRILDAIVDVPFALPTAVAGIALAAAWGPHGFFGKLFAGIDVKTAYSPIGVFIALVFVAVPFTVRSVQPVLEQVDPALEEAAATLGATRWQTFWRVVMPKLWPSLLTGFSLSFARAVGEYGSVIFMSGNLQGKTETTPFLIATKLGDHKVGEATALAVVMLVVSFLVLIGVSALQARTRRVARRQAARPAITGPENNVPGQLAMHSESL